MQLLFDFFLACRRLTGFAPGLFQGNLQRANQLRGGGVFQLFNGLFERGDGTLGRTDFLADAAHLPLVAAAGVVHEGEGFVEEFAADTVQCALQPVQLGLDLPLALLYPPQTAVGIPHGMFRLRQFVGYRAVRGSQRPLIFADAVLLRLYLLGLAVQAADVRIDGLQPFLLLPQVVPTGGDVERLIGKQEFMPAGGTADDARKLPFQRFDASKQVMTGVPCVGQTGVGRGQQTVQFPQAAVVLPGFLPAFLPHGVVTLLQFVPPTGELAERRLRLRRFRPDGFQLPFYAGEFLPLGFQHRIPVRQTAQTELREEFPHFGRTHLYRIVALFRLLQDGVRLFEPDCMLLQGGERRVFLPNQGVFGSYGFPDGGDALLTAAGFLFGGLLFPLDLLGEHLDPPVQPGKGQRRLLQCVPHRQDVVRHFFDGSVY